MAVQLKRIVVTVSKVFLWIILSLILLLIAIIIAIQIPAVQNSVTQKAVHFVSDKTHTKVTLGHINIGFPKSIVLKDLFLEDLKHDTLLYSHRLSVDIDMFKILSHKIEFNQIEIEQLTAHITRSMPDSSFNFDFLMAAFGAGDTTAKTEPDTSKSPWKIALKGIDLKKIHFTFADETAGRTMQFSIGGFNTQFKDFDLDEKRFHIKNINVDHTTASIVQTQAAVSSDTASESGEILYDIDVKDVNLSTLNVLFQTPVQKLVIQVDKAGISANKIDLPGQQISLKKFNLSNSSIDFAINKYITADTVAEIAKEAVSEDSSEQQTKPWKVTLENLELKGNTFAFNNANTEIKKSGIDFSHLLLSKIEADVKDILYDGNNIAADINELKGSEQSGFELKHLKTKITYDSIHAELANLDLETGNSHIKKYIAIAYPSIETIADSIASLTVNADLDHIVIGFRDLLLLQPELEKQLNDAGFLAPSIHLNAKIIGTVNDLHIPLFELTAGNNTALILNGNVKGLPEASNAYFDLNLKKFTTTKADLQLLVKQGMLPASIEVPGMVAVSGFFKGYMKDFDGKADITSSFGNAQAKVTMSKRETYNASVIVDHFDLGKLLRQPETLGLVTMKANVIGSGLSVETMKGKADVEVQQAVLKNYNYHNISVNGDFTATQFDGNAAVDDSNIALTFNGLLNFDTLQPYYKATLDVKGIDLQALHFMEQDLRVSGLFKADIRGRDLNDLNGTVDLRKVALTKNDSVYVIDSLLFVSLSETSNKSIDINSPFMKGNFKGNIGVADLASALKEHLNRYIKLGDTTIKPQSKAQNFTFDLQLKDADLYSVLVPGLKKFIPGKISGNFDSESHVLDLSINIPKVIYNTLDVDSFNLNVTSDAEILHYDVALNSASNGDYRILNPEIKGEIENDTAGIHLTVGDASNNLKYVLSGNLSKQEEDWRFRLLPDSTMLNYKIWEVAPDNYVLVGKKTLYANNVSLTSGEESVKVATTGQEKNAPLEVSFKNFNIRELTDIIDSDEVLAAGLMNGTVLLKNLQETPAFNADLLINDFSFKQDTLGTIKLKADNETANRYHAEMNLNGQGNELSINGFYDVVQTKNALNFKVDISNINLATLEAFAFGQVTDLKGALKGNLKLTGATAEPILNGNLNFKDAGFNVTYVNSYYELKDEELVFNNSKLTFPNFALSDPEGNKAVVTGWVEPDPKQTVRFDLAVDTKNFLAINSSKSDSGQFHGRAILDSYTKITGTKDFTKISSNLKLDDGSALSITRPKEQIKNIESRGVVIFVDRIDSLHRIMTHIKRDTATVTASEFKGMDISANIEINRNSSLAIVIDPVSGDSLQLRGDATLSFSLDPSGKTSLTGRYEISEGSYRLTFYDLIKRNFIFKEGFINWNGDPMEADIDLTALYEVRTSPIDLVADQLTDDQSKNSAQQQLPFQLYMYMKGELLKPDITFSLDLPANERGALDGSVYAKLNQLNENESDLNKQVFALLLLNRFVGEDPLQSSKENSAENVARNSVSQLLSQQLNRFAGNYIKGVQLNVNLQSYEDYSTGQAEGRTELELGVSKQLLNNRLNVQVGGNIDLEGEKAKENTLSNIAGDVSGEYKLIPEGTYRLRFYRRSDYDILQGEIIETAFGLVFTRDYDLTRELFKRDKKKEDKKTASDNSTVKPPTEK